MQLTITIPRRVLYAIVAATFLYLGSYALLRTSGTLLRISSNNDHYDIREVASSGFPAAYSPLDVAFAPLRGVEYLYWTVAPPR